MADRPTGPSADAVNDAHWRTAGDRIQTLLDSCAASGAAAFERAEQLVHEVVGLYGAGLERILQLAGDCGSDTALAERLATDDLVASLLLVHGLHPHGVRRRVSDALDRVRPYLGSHGGDIELLEVVPGCRPGDNTVRLAFKGSCTSCPSSAVTLELAVEDAIRAAAPEISSIELVTAEPSGLIPADSLLAQVRSNCRSGPSWYPAPELDELRPGEIAGFLVAGTAVLASRVGGQMFAYRDHCPICDGTLAGAVLQGALLRCPRCQSHFDVVHAGTGANGAHLDPLPLLRRDGVLSVALRAEATGAPV